MINNPNSKVIHQISIQENTQLKKYSACNITKINKPQKLTNFHKKRNHKMPKKLFTTNNSIKNRENNKVEQFWQKTQMQKQNISDNIQVKYMPVNNKQNISTEINPLKQSDSLNKDYPLEELSEFRIFFKEINSQPLKKQKDWFSKFIKNSAISNTNDDSYDDQESFEILQQKKPGPQSYNPNQMSKNLGSNFSKAQRFLPFRPITAEVNYPQFNKSQKKQNIDIDYVSFGTSKHNLRSQVKKIQQCQWKRSHCCLNSKGLQEISKQRARHKDASFLSKTNRFFVKKSYSNKDYYQSDKSSIKKDNDLPNYYFIQPKENSRDDIQQDKRDYYGQQFATFSSINKQKKANTQNMSRKQNLADPQFIEIVSPLDQDGFQQKNSLGHKNRKRKNPIPPPFHPPEQQSGKQSLRKACYHKNSWMTLSFNVKFQSSVKIL